MSDVRIDSISLEVDSSAAISSAGIDKLAASLKNLKDNAKLTSTANNLSKLSTSLQSLQNVSESAQKMKSLATAINQLSGVRDLSNFRKATNALKNFNSSLSGMQNVKATAKQMKSLASAMEPLSALGKTTLGSTLNQLKKIPDITAGLEPKVIEEFAKRIKELSVALAPLAQELNVVATGFGALPKNVRKAIGAMENMDAAGKKNLGTLGSLKLSWLAYGYAIRTVGNLLTTAFTSFTERYETMNLFAVSMGEYTDEAYEYAQKVQDVLGVNASEWAKNQAVFMQLIAGFGEARDQAYEMSKGLTQITYDLSSLFNVPVEEAFTKVQSGISGELEPLRRWGFDLSQTRLQEIALANGITKKVSAMNQAEKSELRYIAITEQMPNVIEDMSRTLESPANALRILKSQFSLLSQTIGSLLNVVISKFIPYIMAMTKVIIAAANAISVLLTGKSLKDWDKESFGMSESLLGASGAADDLDDSTGSAADNLKDAADNAKKAKQYMMGWDELNTLDTSSASSGSGGSGGSAGVGGGGLGLDLDSLWAEGLLDQMSGQLDDIISKVKDILAYVGAIGVAFAAWKIASEVITFLDKLGGLKGFELTFAQFGKGLGLGLLIADIAEFARYFRDFMDNGATFTNVAGMISEFAGMIGDAFLLLGRTEIGGALKVVQGVVELVNAVHGIATNGLNIDDAMTAVRGLSNLAIGIGLLTKNIAVIGVGVSLQGFSTVIREIADNWEAIKEGDWSGVDRVAFAIGAIEAIGGIIVALGTLKIASAGATAATEAAAVVETTATATTGVNTAVATKLTPSLTSLVTNLAIGIVVITEVAVAAMLIVGAIYVLGKELEAVGKAWQPVIDNGSTIATGIAVGTGLLIAIGVATALLGTATVASAGTLPVAIGLGTAMLVLLAGAFVAFSESLIIVANEISDNLAPALSKMGEVLPDATANMETFGGFMVKFAEASAIYAASSAIAGLSGAISTLVGFFSGNPLKTLAKNVGDTYKHAADLNTNLKKANPELKECVAMLSEYKTYIEKIETLTNSHNSSSLSGQMLTNMKVVGENLVTGFADGIKNKASVLKTAGNNAGKDFITGFEEKKSEAQTAGGSMVESIKTGMESKKSMVSTEARAVGNEAIGVFDTTFIGKFKTAGGDMVDALKDGIKDGKGSTNKKGTLLGELSQLKTDIMTIMDDLVADTKAAAREIIAAANEAKAAAASVGVSGGSSGNKSKNSGTKQLASGGTVPSGQLFIANEAGPELVGNIGNTTAVMNNEQIVAAVSSGVARAVASVMGSTSGSQAVEVYLDGEKIYANQKKVARNKGVAFDMGAFAR